METEEKVKQRRKHVVKSVDMARKRNNRGSG
jgi:hypothetical protein